MSKSRKPFKTLPAVYIWLIYWILLWILQTLVLVNLVFSTEWIWLSALDTKFGKLVLGFLFFQFGASVFVAATELSPLPLVELLPTHLQRRELVNLRSHLALCAASFLVAGMCLIIWSGLLFIGATEYSALFSTTTGKVIFLVATALPFIGYSLENEGETSHMTFTRIQRVKREHGRLFGFLYSDFGYFYIIVGTLEFIAAAVFFSVR